jgi:hypothetical protein
MIKKKRRAKKERVMIDGEWYRITPTGRIGAHLTRNGGWETESEHMGKIRSAIRLASKYWKPAAECMEAASRPYTGKDKRIKKEYQCARCKKWGVRATREANHKVECGTLTKYDHLPAFCARTFKESKDDYECLCKTCHKAETARQRRDK